jgi:hypothetical protein
MNVRAPITVDIYRRLLEITKEKLVLSQHYRSVAHIIREASTQYVADGALPLPYNPARFNGSKLQQTLCDEMYPRKKTVVSVDRGLFFAYKQALALRSVELYLLNVDELAITNRYGVECALWLAARRRGIDICDPYFDDERLLVELDIDFVIMRSLQQVASLLGRSPTAREYDELRKAVGGPSLSFLKSTCGSFNEAKKKAGLEEWERGKREKYI